MSESMEDVVFEDYEVVRRPDPREYVRVKRPNQRPPAAPNVLFVNSSSSRPVFYKRLKRLLGYSMDGTPVVRVHALGNAIEMAVGLCLEVKQEYGALLKLSIRTGTVSVVDEYQPRKEIAHLKHPLRYTRLVSVISIDLEKASG